MAKKATRRPAPKRAATKKRTPAAKTYAVSPLRGMPVEEWIATKTSGWQSDVIRRMIGIVAAAAPSSVVAIKWGQPTFEQNGPFAFIKPARAHVSFGFWRGAQIADPRGILERGDRMGHFKLTAPDQLDEAALAEMVRDAVRLNAAKGSPTVR
ncbi:MAG TPA: DUF1801 domain-containing protein [Myxococcota bacterium]|jgi:hypothetical protein|nr:DUF1801 domain-containing protein [Myxococcota bacterium]